MSSPKPFTIIGSFRKTRDTERRLFLAHVIAHDTVEASRAAACGIKSTLPFNVSVKTEIVMLGHIEPFDMTAHAYTESMKIERKNDETRCLCWWNDETKVVP